MHLSPEIIKIIFRYSGITALFIFFLYLSFWSTINKKFFPSLTQRRKMFILTLFPLLIWSMGILAIFLIFIKENKQVLIKQGFVFGGQIVNENWVPISNAYAYVIIKNDTIKAEAPTGDDGLFAIKLDTTEGIKTTIYYGHPKYGRNMVFRPLTSSVPERLVLKNSIIPQKTFSINSNDNKIITAIEKTTGMKYKAQNATHSIKFQYDKKGLDNFDNRYRYLGGPVQILIDQKVCCQSSQYIKATNAAGNNFNELELHLTTVTEQIIIQEQELLIKKISTCIKRHS